MRVWSTKNWADFFNHFFQHVRVFKYLKITAIIKVLVHSNAYVPVPIEIKLNGGYYNDPKRGYSLNAKIVHTLSINTFFT